MTTQSDTVICAICGKSVLPKDRPDHLKSAHLGPHYFRLNGRPYRTMHPSMRCADLLRVLELPMNSYLWEMRDGKEVDYGHVNAIDLTRQPQLFLHIHKGPSRLQDGRSEVEETEEAALDTRAPMNEPSENDLKEAAVIMEAFWADLKIGPRYQNGKAIGTSFSHNKAVERIAVALAARAPQHEKERG